MREPLAYSFTSLESERPPRFVVVQRRKQIPHSIRSRQLFIQDTLLEPTESIDLNGFITLVSEDIRNNSGKVVDEKGEVVEYTVGGNARHFGNLEGENWIWASDTAFVEKPVVASSLMMQKPQRTYKPE